MPPSPATGRWTIEEALIFETGPGHRRRFARVQISEVAPGRRAPQRRHRPAGPHRAGGDAPLCAAQPARITHRQRALSAGLLHDEAQPASQREDGAVAGLRRSPSAGSRLHRAGRAGSHRHAGALAEDADRHAGGGHVAQGGRAWRAVRHDGHRRRLEAKGEATATRAGAGIGPWHQPRHRRFRRLHGRSKSRPMPDGRCRCAGREGRAGPGRGGDHADQSQHLRTVREARSSTLPRRCTRRAPTSIATAPTSTPSSARCGRAISASTPCTSTCTRPSRRRMAAAVRAPVRWCCRSVWRPIAPIPLHGGRWQGPALIEDAGEAPERRQAVRPHVAFHGQMGMFVRALAYMLSHGPTACARPRRTRCSTPTTSWPR
jgi:hypothetical protein